MSIGVERLLAMVLQLEHIDDPLTALRQIAFPFRVARVNGSKGLQIAGSFQPGSPAPRYRQINLSRAKGGSKRNAQSRCRDRDLPVVGGFGSENPKRPSRNNYKMALEIEGIVDDGMPPATPDLRRGW